MKQHELKTWPEYFDAIKRGDKTFEVRRDDRGFQVGDKLRLREWMPKTQRYSGREITADITFIMRNPQFGVSVGFCAMAIRIP